MEIKKLKIMLSMVLLCSVHLVMPIMMNMSLVPAGSPCAVQASKFGMTSCRMVCLPQSAGAITSLRTVLLGGPNSSSCSGISNGGNINLASLNIASSLAKGVYFMVEPLRMPLSYQSLNYYIYDNNGQLLHQDKYDFSQGLMDKDLSQSSGSAIFTICKYAYQVSPNYMFSAPSKSMFFIQSPCKFKWIIRMYANFCGSSADSYEFFVSSSWS